MRQPYILNFLPGGIAEDSLIAFSSPFTVLPGLMNEYRVPELNVQNGVLKSLSFLFEYIGEMGKDYIYAVTPLLEDALMDRFVLKSL
jgi:hypothetical protein